MKKKDIQKPSNSYKYVLDVNIGMKSYTDSCLLSEQMPWQKNISRNNNEKTAELWKDMKFPLKSRNQHQNKIRTLASL